MTEDRHDFQPRDSAILEPKTTAVWEEAATCLAFALTVWMLIGALTLEGVVRPFLETGTQPQPGAVIGLLMVPMGPFVLTVGVVDWIRGEARRGVPQD